MKDIICDEFQHNVSELLIRHRSILDVLSKLQETNARLDRAITKSITGCGCVNVHGQKQNLPPNLTLEEYQNCVSTHLSGELCDHCKDIVEREMGKHLFYLAAVCNLLDINLFDVIIKENNKLKTLGIYNLS